MSASGKSSNRLYEYNRGYSTGGGHGIYAAAGARDRERMLERRAAAAAQSPTPARQPKPPKPAKAPAGPVPASLLGLGFVALHAVAGGVAAARKIRGAR